MRSNRDREYIQLFGETWNYGDGLAGKTLEGFFESGPQLILQTHIQHLTSWPTMQPLIQGTLTKAYYFSSQKPGELNEINQLLVNNNPNELKSFGGELFDIFFLLFNGLGIMRSKTVLKNVLALFCSLLCFRVGIHSPSIHRPPKNFESQHTNQLCYPCDDQHSLAPL